MTNTEIIVNLATIIANQRLEISELKTEVEHLRHELLAMRVEADEPQTCANGCKWLTQYGECTEPSGECHIEYRTEVDEPQTERSEQ